MVDGSCLVYAGQTRVLGIHKTQNGVEMLMHRMHGLEIHIRPIRFEKRDVLCDANTR